MMWNVIIDRVDIRLNNSKSNHVSGVIGEKLRDAKQIRNVGFK